MYLSIVNAELDEMFLLYFSNFVEYLLIVLVKITVLNKCISHSRF